MSRGKIFLFGVLAVIAAAICTRLGIWQLHRLTERRAYNAVIAERMTMPVTQLDDLHGKDTSTIHWRRVHVEAVADYGNEGVLTTRSQAGIPGVQVLTPVTPTDSLWGDSAIIMIRGFVYATDGRTIDHAKYKEGDTLSLDAMVLTYPVVRTGRISSTANPRAVRDLDRDSLTRILGHPLVPFVLLALGDSTVKDFDVIARVAPPAISEGSHKSYAIQWFSFAAIAIVGFVALVLSSRKRSSG